MSAMGATVTAAAFVLAASAHAQAPVSQGQAVLEAHCKMCHDPAIDRAPGREQLGYMMQSQIYDALTNGVMQPMAAGLTDADKHAVASLPGGGQVVRNLPAGAATGQSRCRRRSRRRSWPGRGTAGDHRHHVHDGRAADRAWEVRLDRGRQRLDYAPLSAEPGHQGGRRPEAEVEVGHVDQPGQRPADRNGQLDVGVGLRPHLRHGSQDRLRLLARRQHHRAHHASAGEDPHLALRLGADRQPAQQGGQSPRRRQRQGNLGFRSPGQPPRLGPDRLAHRLWRSGLPADQLRRRSLVRRAQL